ncbi:hypothetical protein ABH966_003807 [Lysinibacillus sp. RC46]
MRSSFRRLTGFIRHLRGAFRRLTSNPSLEEFFPSPDRFYPSLDEQSVA